tara:strand:- start:2227 stop:2418 length:192 start_codon:yes stop_codon:yes gene_type:complete
MKDKTSIYAYYKSIIDELKEEIDILVKYNGFLIKKLTSNNKKISTLQKINEEFLNIARDIKQQ